MRTRCFPCCSITWAATLVLFLSLCSAQARNLSCVADDDTVYATLHRADLLIFGGQKARQLDACWKVMNDRSKWIDMSKPAALPISPKALEVARIAAASTSSNLFTIFDRVSQVESNQVHVFAGLMYWREHGGHPFIEARTEYDRRHLADHFLYGGAAELLCNGGRFAADWKETRDERNGGVYNYSQWAAAVSGAAWVDSRP